MKFKPAPHRTAPHRTAPHRTAPHRTAPHRAAPHRTAPCRAAPYDCKMIFASNTLIMPLCCLYGRCEACLVQ